MSSKCQALCQLIDVSHNQLLCKSGFTITILDEEDAGSERSSSLPVVTQLLGEGWGKLGFDPGSLTCSWWEGACSGQQTCICQTSVLGKTVYLKKRQRWVEIPGLWACSERKLFQKWLPFHPGCVGTYLVGVTVPAQNLRVRGFERWQRRPRSRPGRHWDVRICWAPAPLRLSTCLP